MQWVFLGTFILSLLALVFLWKRISDYTITALPLAALTCHQMEEYIVAPLLLGNDYHFLNWAFRLGVDIAPMTAVSVNLFEYFGVTVL
jgi:MFS-type transporter involved in bile tolerance (Atg22 family)